MSLALFLTACPWLQLQSLSGWLFKLNPCMTVKTQLETFLRRVYAETWKQEREQCALETKARSTGQQCREQRSRRKDRRQARQVGSWLTRRSIYRSLCFIPSQWRTERRFCLEEGSWSHVHFGKITLPAEGECKADLKAASYQEALMIPSVGTMVVAKGRNGCIRDKPRWFPYAELGVLWTEILPKLGPLSLLRAKH